MRFVSLMIVLSFCYAPVALATDRAQQRVWFMQARQALDSGHPEKLTALKAELATYPLAPYLDIQQTWQQLATADHTTDHTVAAILQAYADIPEATDLRRAWVGSMAERGLWPQVAGQLEKYPVLRKALPDIAMMSDWQAGKQETTLLAYSQLWPQQKSPSNTIAPLHQAWMASGHPSDAERWTRIIRLAEKGQWKEIAALSSNMDQQQKQWLAYWRRLQAKPRTRFENWPVSLSHPAPMLEKLPRAILSDGMQRLISKDPLRAHATLQHLKHMNIAGIDPDLYASLGREIALRAAKQHEPTAGKWLAELPESHRDAETRAWQTRLYLLNTDWKNALKVIEGMPAAEQQEDGWQYWKACALDAHGMHAEAHAIYTDLAAGRGYYGFLSAERAGLPYRFNQQEIDVPDSVVQALENRPGIQRAHEWLILDIKNKAEREWYVALADADEQTWKAAALLAARWNWPNQVIRAALRSGSHDALSERFPLQFEGEVLLASDETGLPPSTIWSIIRQESIFNRQARSPAGARGLMQLMPKTAKMVGKQIGLRAAHRELFSPLVNIRLGSRYLANMKSRFDNNLALAAAAYNAGPYRVSQWLKQTPFDVPDVWVEAIPYNETRRYVQHVMAFTIVYQWRGNQPTVSLNEQLGMRLKQASRAEEKSKNEQLDLDLSRAPSDPLP